MLNKVAAVARLLAITLAVVAGFVAIPNLNVGLVIVALSLISGLTMPADRMVPIGITALVLPAVAGAVGLIPAVGTQLAAVATNVALAAAGALGSAIALRLFATLKESLASLSAKD